MLKAGSRVKFQWNDKDGNLRQGAGMVINTAGMVINTALPKDGVWHYLVASDPPHPGAPHHVLYCAETWLIPE